MKTAIVTDPFNYVFQVLTPAQVDQVNSIEGNGVGSRVLAQLLDEALNGTETQAASVAAATANGAITVTTAGGNTYSDAAINAALATAVTDMNAMVTKVNAILTALKASGLMVSP